MNWNCIICGDKFSLNPQPSKHKGYGTFSDGNDNHFICPTHTDKIAEFIDELKQKEQQVVA